MALTVGELAVELEARTADFRRGLSRAEQRMDGFERRATGATRGVGRSFGGLRTAIAGVGAVLATLAASAAVRSLIRLGTSAVQTAGSFETLRIRLRTFLGTQEAANTAFENFLALSSQTPFAVSEIVEGATTLASITGDNREQLETLTAVTANLAAVTGLSFRDAAGNVQRSLAAGLASADLFRERGVRQLIEATLGIPDATALAAGATGELADAFIEVFGEAGRFGSAAEDLSRSIEGAFSNVGDASERFRASLGEALAPAVVDAARGVIIPFFEDLRERVEANSDEIESFAQRAIPGVFGAFETLLSVGAVVVRGLGRVAQALQFLRTWLAAVQTVVVFLVNSFRGLFEIVSRGAGAIASGAQAIAAAARGDFGEARRLAGEAANSFDGLQARFRALTGEIQAAGDVTVELATGIGSAGETMNGLADGLDSAAQAAGRASARFGETAEAAREAGDAARDANTAASVGGGGTALPPPPEGDLPPSAGAGVRSSFDLIESLRKSADLDREALADEADDKGEIFGERFGDRVGTGLTRGIGDALKGLISGEGLDFAETFAQLSSNLLEASMQEVMQGLQESLGDLFQSLTGGEGGGGFGGALAGVAGIGLGLVSGALRDTEANVQRGTFQSAVTSTQQVRGIVAGPSNIPIAQIGESLSEAVAVLEEINREQLTVLRQIARGGGLAGGGGGTVESAADREMAETSTSLG